jgi:hypothetical protein
MEKEKEERGNKRKKGGKKMRKWEVKSKINAK